MSNIRTIKKVKRAKPATGNQYKEIWETYQSDDEYTFDCLTERESGIEEASFRAWQIAEYGE